MCVVVVAAFSACDVQLLRTVPVYDERHIALPSSMGYRLGMVASTFPELN